MFIGFGAIVIIVIIVLVVLSCAGTEPPHCAWPLPCSHRAGHACSCPARRGPPGNRRAPAGPFPDGLPFGPAQQLGHYQQLQQVQAAIDRLGFQVHHGGQQRSELAQRADLGCHPVSGQVRHTPIRDPAPPARPRGSLPSRAALFPGSGPMAPPGPYATASGPTPATRPGPPAASPGSPAAWASAAGTKYRATGRPRLARTAIQRPRRAGTAHPDGGSSAIAR
jgi:hypothetical protein